MKTSMAILSVVLVFSLHAASANVIISGLSASNQAAERAATVANVTVSGKPFGFVTCGKNSTTANSLGCQDWNAEGAPVIPYTAWPGYRLGTLLPASYRITAVSFDSYSGIATIYFEY